MADIASELNERFAPPNSSLAPDVLGELESILRLHSVSPQELFYKWESYSIKMGGEETKLELKTVRDFKKDLQEVLERETRGKAHVRGSERKAVGATPRNVRAGIAMDDIFTDTPRAPMTSVNGNSTKRKSNFETPASKSAKANAHSSPSDVKTPSSTKANGDVAQGVPFSERQNSGEIIEQLNGHIELSKDAPEPPAEPRVKLKANTDMSKYSYKPMAMKLSSASEILDDRIDEFLSTFQAHYELEDDAFGNPTVQSTSDIVVVGRIACDTPDGKLTPSSIVLETSRRTGAGLRVPLKLDNVTSYDFFPGKIVALRGRNSSGEYFTVSEILDTPMLLPAASTTSELDAVRARLGGGEDDAPRPLNLIISSGPYTSDTNLDYEPLHALCSTACESSADAIILLGPFLDIEHPHIRTGQLPNLPSTVNPDTATLMDVFRLLVSAPLQRLAADIPTISIILVPSVRDAVNKHVAFPQDRMQRSALGLPKQVSIVTNPCTLSLNEIVIGMCSEDALYELRREECVHGKLADEDSHVLARASKHIIEQRHFFPLYPPTSRDNLPKPTAISGTESGVADGVTDRKATGAMLDVGYAALAEWPAVRPDILITPSTLAPFAKVVRRVLVVNPGTLAKKRAPGTFARMTVEAAKVNEEDRGENKMVGHNLFERARVDVVRI